MIEALRREDGWALPDNAWNLLDGMEPVRLPTISVIVVHYMQPRQLARTLHAISLQHYPAGLVETIVVDDGSALAPVVPAGVRLIVQPDHGFRVAAARNRGVAAARNQMLVFLDADTAPEPDYLRRITRLPALTWDAVTVGRRRHADLSAADRDVDVATAGRARELEEPGWLRDAYQQTGNLVRSDQRSYRFVVGAVMACSRRFFDEVGGFDEGFTRYGGEDWEWAYRAWVHGAVIAHVPDAVAWHDGPDRSVRDPGALEAKNAEALALAHLIPVAGSRPRAITPEKVDISVTGPPPPASDGQIFVSRDSVLCALPSAQLAESGQERTSRFDRVRIAIVIERPVRVSHGALAEAITAIESGGFGQAVLRSPDGTASLRVISTRAAARQARWAGGPILPDLDLIARGVEVLHAEVDVEAYVGGWG
jgi:GT2 family glycosyltransferase